MNEQANEIMTISEVAVYLQLAERTVLRMAQRGEIPAAKVASQWRFIRPLVREWLVGRMQSPLEDFKLGPGARRPILPLNEVLHPELMTFNLKPGPKESILRQLAAPLADKNFASDPSRLLSSLIDRERLMTTAVGHGFAIPHPRRPMGGMFPEPAIALGICPEGTDFQAIDDQLVHVFFLVCATRDELHLQLMANIAWFVRQEGVIAKLARMSSPQEVMDLVARRSLGSHATSDRAERGE